MSQLWSAIVENSVSRFVAAVSQLVVLVLTARMLGPENRGVLVVVITWSGLFATLAGLSLGQVSHREIQRIAAPNWLSELAGTMILVGAVASGIAYVGFMALVWPASIVPFRGVPFSVLIAAGLLIPLAVLDEYFRNLLAACNQTRHYAVAQTVGGGFRVALVYLAAGPLQLGVGGVIGGLVAGQAVVVGIETRAIWRAAGRRLSAGSDRAKGLLRGALRLHPNTIASFLLVHANVLLLSQLATKSAVAWFQLAMQIAATLLLVPQAAAMRFFGLIAQDGPDAAWPTQRRAMVRVLCLVIVLSVMTAAVAPALVTSVAGDEFKPAADLLRWLLPAVVGMALAELMAPQWYGRGIFVLSTILTVVVAAGNLVLNYVLIGHHGAIGAAWGTTIAFVVIVATAQLAFALWCNGRPASYRPAG